MAIKICISKELRRGSGLSKVNNLNLKDEHFVKELFMFRDRQNLLDEQIKWGILKYEICKFCMVFSKSLQKERREKIHNLEIKIKERRLNNDEKIQLYNRQKLDNFFDGIIEAIRIRNRCQWYLKREKSNKFFLNLEKSVEFKVKYNKL